jgi:hypothetical protein
MAYALCPIESGSSNTRMSAVGGGYYAGAGGVAPIESAPVWSVSGGTPSAPGVTGGTSPAGSQANPNGTPSVGWFVKLATLGTSVTVYVICAS